MTRVRVTDDPEQIDLRLAHEWIATTYWAHGVPWSIFQKACAHSLLFGALDQRELVGFARVVTDRATFAWLCDVFVAEAARGQGVARRLLEAVMTHPDLLGLRQFVLGTRDAHGLYEKFGFERIGDPDGRFMRVARAASELYAR